MPQRPPLEATSGEQSRATTSSLMKEAFRFLIVGALNTIVGYGVFLLLLNWLRYEVAYAIAYVAGIAVSYIFNALFVFRQPLRPRAALYYPLVYLVQFLLGLALLRLLIEMLNVPLWMAPAVVIVLTMPVTFLMSRIIVRAN
jgi:putative flippase GtrA